MSSSHELSRRSLIWSLTRLTLPIWGAEIAQMAISLISISMIGHYSTLDQAAVSVGVALWVPMFLLIAGSFSGLTSVIAHHFGARQPDKIRHDMWQMIWITLVLGGSVTLLLWCATPWLMAIFHAPPALAEAGEHYIYALLIGLPALMGYLLLLSYSNGMNHTRPNLIFNIMAIIIDVPLTYLMIHGGTVLDALPFAVPQWAHNIPAHGAQGCGIASAITYWLIMFAMLLYTVRHRIYREVRLWQRPIAPHWARISELLRTCLPLGVSVLAEATLFTMVALLCAPLGAQVVAAHEITTQLIALMFMTPMSFGIAVMIKVSTYRGLQQPQLARRTALLGIAMAVAIAVINDLFLLIFGRQLLGIFTTDIEVLTLALHLMLLGMLFQLSDALQATMSAILRGYKDNRIVMYITVLSYWAVGMVIGIALAKHGISAPWGVYGYWVGMTVGLTVAAVLLGLRLRHTIRKDMQHYHAQEGAQTSAL
ncbi:MATE family efflux transporter [Zymobacter palmae]|uniref:Multidrug-efflux transporter n=1 Tax=Zymobacter palmae TaxID=33074 RepID=A0A348HE97_9GAMM|nr:MATE family efflux transporter [Zymobacter palmae]BBG29949.1 Na+-driven multidrug efflux pump [Zymobacter palmae]